MPLQGFPLVNKSLIEALEYMFTRKKKLPKFDMPVQLDEKFWILPEDMLEPESLGMTLIESYIMLVLKGMHTLAL